MNIEISHSAVRLRNCIVVIGGVDRAARPYAHVGSGYTIFTQRSGEVCNAQVKTAPDQLYGAVAVAIEDSIYTFGGNLAERNALWTLSRTEDGCFTWTFIEPRCEKESPSSQKYAHRMGICRKTMGIWR